MVSNRSSIALLSARCSTSPTASFQESPVGGGPSGCGSSLTCATICADGVEASNGGRPHSAWYATMASAY